MATAGIERNAKALAAKSPTSSGATSEKGKEFVPAEVAEKTYIDPEMYRLFLE